MRHLVQLAPNHPEISTSCRLAILDGTAGTTPSGSGLRSLLESLRGVAVASLGFLVWLACSGAPQPSSGPVEEQPASPKVGSFIVQGTDLATVLEAVRKVGGEVTHELALIRAVGARLTASQRTELEGLEGITRIYEDRAVSIQAQRLEPDAGSVGRPFEGRHAKHLEAGE